MDGEPEIPVQASPPAQSAAPDPSPAQTAVEAPAASAPEAEPTEKEIEEEEKKIFNDFDKNKDGVLEPEEFVDYLKGNPQALEHSEGVQDENDEVMASTVASHAGLIDEGNNDEVSSRILADKLKEPAEAPADEGIEGNRPTGNPISLTLNDASVVVGCTMACAGKILKPGIDKLQILGNHHLGKKLMACGEPTNGMTLCMFQWIRVKPDNTVISVEGATTPEYTLSALDVGCKIGGLYLLGWHACQ